ncbi:hypothetical protein HC251_17120 [Iamia sp. SCSIO 61187]|uniref:hypothetical protein n=1 Tax=Iamia sp. SCSIO 61187 TaxID=2722752 RepID=UPI001C62CF64|nr:hypothetical protein [Iamia sp. SCSIO 61187]QYG93985.1 hypothetical protein HC251_17120 [Iamia sp. SCSIO 61187]
MHPIEHLRYVARAGGADPVDLASEAAHALGAFDDDPAGLVAAARQLVARHRAVGPLWWLCSRVLVAPEPMAEGLAAARELEADPTDGVLAAFLPDEARVLIVGWPATVVPALARRGDLDVLAADDGTGVDVGRALARVDIPVLDVPSQGVGAAAATAEVVLLEALAAGPAAALCAPGSRSAAAVARAAGRTVWLVAGVGRVLPGPTYDACAAGAVDPDEPWEADLDVVPLDLVDRVVRTEGPVDVATGVASPGCPVAPELLVPARTPGSFQP